VRDVARDLARVNMGVFLSQEFDAIVTNAAGCGSTLKEYDHLFPVGVPEHERARAFRAKMRDVTEFLDELGPVAPLGALPWRVTYQDSCHLAHGQKVREAPRRLIRAVPGVELAEMRLADNCCGSAGVYNVTQTATSLELLAEKMDCARQTRAAVIVTANPGCLLQLRAGAEMHGTGQEVLHVVELLDRAQEAATSRR
jgi:glycolate oxidase iron-sulfur subunit